MTTTRPPTDPDHAERDVEYAKAVGARLRHIRTQQDLSLDDVQQRSHGRWNAAAVGSYERGDRMITVGRLAELAAFYGVPVPALLRDEPRLPPHPRNGRRIVLDLAALAETPDEAAEPLRRYATAVLTQRGDYNGRVLSIRYEDLRSLAAVYKARPGDVPGMLAAWGVLAASPVDAVVPS